MKEKQIIYNKEKLSISKEKINKMKELKKQESNNSSKELDEKSTVISTTRKKSNIKEIEEEEEIEKAEEKEEGEEIEEVEETEEAEEVQEVEEVQEEEEKSNEENNDDPRKSNYIEEKDKTKNENIMKSKEETGIADLKRKVDELIKSNDELIKSNTDNKNKINELIMSNNELIKSNTDNQNKINELTQARIGDQKQINELIKSNTDFIKYKNENEKDKAKLIRAIGALHEINNQNEKYIKYNLNIKLENLQHKFELLLGSYKILFIRKTANIFLMELLKRYSKHFIEVEFKKNHKKHSVTVCKMDLKGINNKTINLIIDFLKFIKRKASSMIHIQDEDFEFQKEILYESLDKKIPSKKESGMNISLNDAMSIIFQKKNIQKKEIQKKDKTFYKNMKNIIQCEIAKNNNSDEEEKNSEKYDEENPEKIFDEKEEEERIKKIFSDDRKSIKTNLSSILEQLLAKIKLNQEIVEPDKKLKNMKIIDGNFFFNAWKESFKTERMKSHETFKFYVDEKEIGSLANMGVYLQILLKGLNFNFYMTEPNKLDKVFNNNA